MSLVTSGVLCVKNCEEEAYRAALAGCVETSPEAAAKTPWLPMVDGLFKISDLGEGTSPYRSDKRNRVFGEMEHCCMLPTYFVAQLPETASGDVDVDEESDCAV